jgi:hypothetical protein
MIINSHCAAFAARLWQRGNRITTHCCVHESSIGLRHIWRRHAISVAEEDIADIRGQAGPATLVANDPFQTFDLAQH